MPEHIISGIYAIVNTTNGNHYIGSAVNIHKRWDAHCLALARGKHHSAYLQRAYDLHGHKAFLYVVLEPVNQLAHLLEREQFYLDTMQPEYNICLKAGSAFGRHWTEEQRHKMINALKGRSMPEETKQKISETLKGRSTYVHTEEVHRRIALAHKGKTISEKQRRQHSEMMKGRIISEEWRRNISEGKKGKKIRPPL